MAPRVADSVLVKAYRKGQSLERIAAEWRVPERTVASRLKRVGVVLRSQGRPRKGAAGEAALREMAYRRFDPPDVEP